MASSRHGAGFVAFERSLNPDEILPLKTPLERLKSFIFTAQILLLDFGYSNQSAFARLGSG